MTVTILIAWASLSVGIVMGAAWRALCEKQSSGNNYPADGSVMLHRLHVEPRSWHGRLDRTDPGTRRQAY